VTEPGRLWLTRLWVIWQAWRRGKRRSWQGEEKRSWCFNLWLDSDHLDLFQDYQSLYTAYELIQAQPVLDRGEVATRYGFVDGRGEVGFVSSISEPFCGDCHRARLSADGQLYTCLFASQGSDLRAALAAGEPALRERIAAIWSRRGDRYSELRTAPANDRKKIEMYFIGG